MKKIICLIVIGQFIFSSCETTKNTAEQTASNETEASMENQPSEGVVLWSSLVVREEPSDKGKYITSIYQGEKLKMFNNIEKDSTSKDENKYVKVMLSDGTEGWVQERFLSRNGRAASIKDTSPVYKRPDLLTKSDKEFVKMDFVAVTEVNGEWVQVKGVPTGSTWFTEGWIKSDKITTEPVDISFAVLANKALKQEDEVKRVEELKKVVDNVDFQSSIFYTDLIEMVYPKAKEPGDEEILLTDGENEQDSSSISNH